jgi:hypothetical protein
MTEGHAAPHRRATLGYVPAAGSLLAAARENRSNTAFAEFTGDVVYILDANVAVHYLQAGGAGHGQLSFGNLLQSGKATKLIAETSDRLTVEYLLSGALPGQVRRPVFMTPPHWNEALGKAERIARDVLTLPTTHKSSLRQLQEEQDPRRRLALAGKLLPREIAEAVSTASAVNRRLRAAFAGQQPKLRPLDMARDIWPSALDRIRLSDVKRWRAILADERNKARIVRPSDRRASLRRKGGRETSQNLDNDAEALAIIQALYRENPEACGIKRTRLLLLVTADQAIISAVEARKSDLAEEGIPLFAQHPRVFSPILNFSAMSAITADPRGEVTSEPAERQQVFVDVETALDRLFPQEGPSNEQPPIESQRAAVRMARHNWSMVARQLIAAHASFFSEDSEAALEAAQMLVDPGKLQELTQNLLDAVESIGEAHGRFGMRSAIQRLPQTVRQSRQRGFAALRAPLQVIEVDLLQVIRNVLPAELNAERNATVGLYRLLDEIADSTRGVQLADKIANELSVRLAATDQSKEAHAQAHLLTACIYIALGEWQSGRECARRARDVSDRRGVLRREANYCVALANRFLLRSQRDYHEAEKCLGHNIEDRDIDRSVEGQVAAIRDQVERAALRMTACLLDAIDDAKPFQRVVSDLGPDIRLLQPSDLPETFGRAADQMAAQRRALDDNFSGPPSNAGVAHVLKRLRRQLFTNLVGVHLFRRVLAPRLAEPSSQDELESAIERLREELNPTQQTQMTQVYLALADFLLDRNALNYQAAVNALAPNTPEDRYRSEVDEIEFDYLRSFLNSVDWELDQLDSGPRAILPAEDHIAILDNDT